MINSKLQWLCGPAEEEASPSKERIPSKSKLDVFYTDAMLHRTLFPLPIGTKMVDIFDAALGLEEQHVQEGYEEGLQ